MKSLNPFIICSLLLFIELPAYSQKKIADKKLHEHPARFSIDYDQQDPDRELWKAEIEKGEAAELFQRRILPLLKSETNSCAECHFAGVDLKSLILPDQAKTFASLRTRRLIDVEHPDQSKILEFIARSSADATELQNRVRAREFQAFRAWIHQAAKEPELLKAQPEQQVGTELPPEVIRHARRDRVLQSFVNNVWSQMGRCISCHSPDRNQRIVAKHGDDVSWIVPHDPAATLDKLVETNNIDLEFPNKSPVLTKPTGEVKHGGHIKFTIGSQSDKSFRRFLNDYVAVMNNQYKTSEQLPEPRKFTAVASEQFLRIVELPPRFEDKLLRVELYNEAGGKWSKQIIGQADNLIKKGRWQSPIFKVAVADPKHAKQLREDSRLPTGKYQVKIFVDRNDKVTKNRDYELGEDEFVAHLQIGGEWKPGYKEPKIARFPRGD